MSTTIRNDTWVGTVSGKRIDFLEPDESQINIQDIATGLANVARFVGQTPVHYSVAQHSVFCSRKVSPENALQALLHDASEAYMGDCPRPLKVVLGDSWRDIEKRVQKAIFRRFGLPEEMAPEIKEVDNRMVVTEHRMLQPNGTDWTGAWLDEYEPYDYVSLGVWSPEKARCEFLARFVELSL